jgi:hypothetical protein
MLEVTLGSMLNSRIEFLKRVLKNQQDTGYQPTHMGI